MLVGFQHGEVAVAGQELDGTVLPGLEAGGLAELAAEFGVFAWSHGPENVPGAGELLEDARHPGEHLEGRLQPILADRKDRRAYLVDGELHPQFRGLVLDDEEQFVMRGGKRFLRLQHLFEMQIVAIGHASSERHLGAALGGIVGFAAHVTSAFF